MKNVIHFNNVSKSYNDTHALSNVSFEIKEGEAVGLLGNNGSGKTTAINIISGLLSYKGECQVFGEKVTAEASAYRIQTGFVLSRPFYINAFTVKQYLTFAGNLLMADSNTQSAQQKGLLEYFELDPDKEIKSLSKGNQAKVSICASLIHNPRLLVLDEPFTNLDITTVTKYVKLLNDLKGKKTLLITSHSLGVIVELCDRIIALDKGKVIADFKDIEDKELLKNQITALFSSNRDLSDLNWLN